MVFYSRFIFVDVLSLFSIFCRDSLLSRLICINYTTLLNKIVCYAYVRSRFLVSHSFHGVIHVFPWDGTQKTTPTLFGDIDVQFSQHLFNDFALYVQNKCQTKTCSNFYNLSLHHVRYIYLEFFGYPSSECSRYNDTSIRIILNKCFAIHRREHINLKKKPLTDCWFTSWSVLTLKIFKQCVSACFVCVFLFASSHVCA